MKRFGLVLLFCLKVKTEQQNQSRSLQTSKRHRNTKYSKGSGTALVVERGGGVIKRFSVSAANREGVHRSARNFFLFHFFFSFFFNCFTPFYVFSLTTEPDPRLHRPFHIETFFPSRVKQVVFLETYSG